MNDSGTVVGLRFTPDALTHAVVWTREKGLMQLEKPAGYVRSEALAVNNAGDVVGMVDGPGGSEVGPNAFVYAKGRFRLLDEGGPTFVSATAINDQGQITGSSKIGRRDAQRPRQAEGIRPVTGTSFSLRAAGTAFAGNRLGPSAGIAHNERASRRYPGSDPGGSNP